MTTDTQAAQAEVGQARPRKEDARLVTGQTNWTDRMWTCSCSANPAGKTYGSP